MAYHALFYTVRSNKIKKEKVPMKKRILAGMLSFCMLVSFFPASAFSLEENEEQPAACLGAQATGGGQIVQLIRIKKAARWKQATRATAC